ncbi:hypothetical protein [Chitinophaga sp.]|uniref:hypothetical protein n=1 Tax=Chitinophaga sp. TaxID=1869181 RepID=UPI002F95F303
MTENTTPATETVLTDEQKTEIFNSLPAEFQQTVVEVNGEIDEHNKNVAKIISAEAKDPKLIKAEIFEQSKDKVISRLRSEELALLAQVEELRKQGYAHIEKSGLMPEELNEEQLAKLKSDVAESGKSIKDKVAAFIQIENMMPTFKGKISVLLAEVKNRRGVAKTGGTSSQEGTKRPRFARITINDVTQDEKGNKVFGMVNGEEKYTFTFASQYLKKQHKGIKWSPKDLQDAYYASVPDADNVPEKHTFEMPYTFKDGAGNDQTIVFKIGTVKA